MVIVELPLHSLASKCHLQNVLGDRIDVSNPRNSQNDINVTMGAMRVQTQLGASL